MIVFLLHLAGAAALLIWAVRLIRTGVERAFMTRLRLILRRSEDRPVIAAVSGAGAAMLLQSSTAVALIVAGFTVSGSLAAPAGLALVLGADLGSAVAAQILLVRAGWLVPMLLLAGALLFLRGDSRTVRQTGRIVIGLALVFVSIDMIRDATAPLQDSAIVAMLIAHLDADPLSAFVLGAVAAYAVHSSLAAVLMFATFVAAGVLPVMAGVALVLGANLGGAVIPFVLTLSMPPPARRVALANLLLRGGGAALALLAVVLAAPDLTLLATAAHQQVIIVHMLFNLCLVLAGLALAAPATRLATAIVPDDQPRPTLGPVSALDPKALDEPEHALACAGREALRMGEQVAAMLTPSLSLYETWNAGVAASILQAEDDVDLMHFEIKMFIARLQEGRLSPEQSRRAMDLVTIANNLEDAGDKISTNMIDMARRMREQALRFSSDGWRDLEDFHDCVLSNTQLALGIMVSRDTEVARQLIEEKDRVRQVEQDLQARHLDRLRQGGSDSIETSNLHQETIRALKQVNTALSSVAYPIAEEAGDLLSSRLAAPENGDTVSQEKKPSTREAKA
ncbi:MAG: Na/Pi cotransporter family protein [Rhodobacteraceae bacterium]|nr:Na/Pi cotransporter family protein [Paracoccaceae bacterium]